jgi:hypothetical protein
MKMEAALALAENTEPDEPAEPAGQGPAPADAPALPRRLRKDGQPDKRYMKPATSGRSARRAEPARIAPARQTPARASQSPTVAKMLQEPDADLAVLQRAHAALVEAA